MNWNKETNHMMVDLETLGMDTNAIVISASAIIFNSESIVGDYYEEFRWDQWPLPTSVTPDTLQFWFKQVQEGEPIPMGEATPGNLPLSINRLYKDHACETIWAQGTDFDIPKLKFHFDQIKMEVPWKYNAVRDCRTVFKLFEGRINLDHLFCTDKHNALADAVYQVQKLQCVLNALKDWNVL